MDLYKVIINLYINSIDLNDYLYLQSLFTNEADILYYLNPLKFKNLTTQILPIMRINNRLDYSGFISACSTANIDNQALSQFKARINC